MSTNNFEDFIYNIIKESGDSGITQQDLAKKVGLSARELSIILKKLIEKKKITKRSIKENGRSKIKYFAITENESIKLYINLISMQNVPCFTCRYLFKCGNGIHISPSSCSKFFGWMIREIGTT
jgi:alkylated DNA nucleotide flippase Atl1